MGYAARGAQADDLFRKADRLARIAANFHHEFDTGRIKSSRRQVFEAWTEAHDAYRVAADAYVEVGGPTALRLADQMNQYANDALERRRPLER